MVLYSTLWYYMALYSTLWYSMVLYSTLWYSMVLYGTHRSLSRKAPSNHTSDGVVRLTGAQLHVRSQTLFHICTGTRLTRCYICIGIGPTRATSSYPYRSQTPFHRQSIAFLRAPLMCACRALSHPLLDSPSVPMPAAKFSTCTARCSRYLAWLVQRRVCGDSCLLFASPLCWWRSCCWMSCA
jgi:hypothetical protein